METTVAFLHSVISRPMHSYEIFLASLLNTNISMTIWLLLFYFYKWVYPFKTYPLYVLKSTKIGREKERECESTSRRSKYYLFDHLFNLFCFVCFNFFLPVIWLFDLFLVVIPYIHILSWQRHYVIVCVCPICAFFLKSFSFICLVFPLFSYAIIYY